MKKIVLLAGMVLSLGAAVKSDAQVRVSLQIGQPVVQQSWYSRDNDYYYLPEQGVYYNVRRKVYVYPENGSWVYASRLPSRYGNYSYRSSRYVRVRDRSPFDRDNVYRQRYQSNYGGYRHDNGNHRGWDNRNNPHSNDRHDNRRDHDRR